MDPSCGQPQPQQMSSQTLENMLGCSKAGAQQDRKPRPQPEEALKCPRCDSTNTKFCYYNNYSLSQPRYFCKSCRRYWTRGGTLRNVPVGGGCRKNNKRSSSSSSSKRAQDQSFTPNPNPLNSLPHQDQTFTSDFTLALARLQKQSGGYNEQDLSIMGYPTTTASSFCDVLGSSGMNPSSTNNPGFLDALRSGFFGSSGTHSSAQYNAHQNNNMYSVYGNGDTGEVDSRDMMMLPYDHHAMKQEPCSGGGMAWQLLNGGSNMGEVDSSGRGGWNGFTPSNWHGLLHSPLM